MWLVISFAMLASITAGYLIGARAPKGVWRGPGADMALGAVVGMVVGIACAVLAGSETSVSEDIWILLIALLSPYGILLLLRVGVARLMRTPRQ